MTHLIQLFLPLADRDDRPFARSEYEAIEHQLVSQFEGFTAYRQAPASGLWLNEADEPERDKLVIYEVMTPALDRNWWKAFREKLEQQFRQDQILIRSYSVEVL